MGLARGLRGGTAGLLCSSRAPYMLSFHESSAKFEVAEERRAGAQRAARAAVGAGSREQAGANGPGAVRPRVGGALHPASAAVTSEKANSRRPVIYR